MKRILISGALLLWLAVPLLAQQQGTPPANTPPYVSPPRMETEPRPGEPLPPDMIAPPATTLTNMDVEREIQRAIDSEAALADPGVKATVDTKSVVLTGIVGSEEQHDLVLAAARKRAGTRQVVDKIQVRRKT